MNSRLLPCGEDALLVEVDGPPQALGLASAVRAAVSAGVAGFADVVDVVPAARTVLVTVADGAGIDALRSALVRLASAPEAAARPDESRVVEVPVRYDGPDVDDVATATSLDRTDLVAAHTGTEWQVGFGGFAPGFFYLTGGDPRLRVPRRPQPRTSVPAGSVALAGGESAIYPRATPGGWQLIGRTDLVMFDVDRRPPALLAPGMRVRFVEVSP